MLRSVGPCREPRLLTQHLRTEQSIAARTAREVDWMPGPTYHLKERFA